MNEETALVMVENDSLVRTENKDYMLDLESLAISVVDTIFRIGKPKINLRKFRLEITPSIDSGIGPHLDADVYTEINGKYEFISHATLLSNCLGDCTNERAGYVRALADADGQIDFSLGPIEYQVTLKKEITYSDSNLLGFMLSEALRPRED